MFNTKKLSLIKTNKYQWKRIKDIFPKYKPKIFDTIDPNNFIQTDLCNFYFGAALSALAENPQRLMNLFGSQIYNENGFYYVRICQDGVWRYVIIDDFIPVNENNMKRAAFINPRFFDKVFFLNFNHQDQIFFLRILKFIHFCLKKHTQRCSLDIKT